jgi:hypothetical protein
MSTTYLFLRTARILLWGAFLISLGSATSFKESNSLLANLIRYAPPVMLVLALVVGFVERTVRKRAGLPARRFGQG